MKLRSSSSGGASRPVKGAPARAGSTSCAGRGDTVGEASAGARAGRGTAAPQPRVFPDAERAGLHRRQQRTPATTGREGRVAGGGCDQSTHAEDGPGTWEALASPRHLPVWRRAGDPSPTHGTGRAHGSSARSGTEQAPAAREAAGQGHRSRGRGGQGVGGRQTREAVGARRGPRPRPSTGGPCRGALQEGPRAKALTVADRSPGRRKGVERAKRAPAGRLHSLAPLRDGLALKRASSRQRADAAGGGEEVPKDQDGQSLEANLQDRHARRKAQRSRQQPLRRVHLPTAQGKTRPRGLAACEDQLVQDAVREGLEAVEVITIYDILRLP
jgi:hypothetical protein